MVCNVWNQYLLYYTVYIYIYIYGKKKFPCDRKVPFWVFFTLPTSKFLLAGPKGVFLCVSRRALSWWKHQNLKIFTNDHKISIKDVLSGHLHPYVHMYGVYLESPIMSEIIQNPSDTLHMHSGMTQSSYCDLLIGFEGVNRKCWCHDHWDFSYRFLY